jgi:hypothetical protein
MTPDDDFREQDPAQQPLTGSQFAYLAVRGGLYVLLPTAVIVTGVIVFSSFMPDHDWRWLVQTTKGGGGDWKAVGEYADEAACLQEARIRNEPKPDDVWFACYSKDESPDDEESLQKVLERGGFP